MGVRYPISSDRDFEQPSVFRHPFYQQQSDGLLPFHAGTSRCRIAYLKKCWYFRTKYDIMSKRLGSNSNGTLGFWHDIYLRRK